ncbi:hypothetical protein BC829DRAFT_397794 [Chytridium lagenaria]|nr:hypothetical protein BC829DRAFT_397794 [Chytridium lagenaria]
MRLLQLIIVMLGNRPNRRLSLMLLHRNLRRRRIQREGMNLFTLVYRLWSSWMKGKWRMGGNCLGCLGCQVCRQLLRQEHLQEVQQLPQQEHLQEFQQLPRRMLRRELRLLRAHQRIHQLLHQPVLPPVQQQLQQLKVADPPVHPPPLHPLVLTTWAG